MNAKREKRRYHVSLYDSNWMETDCLTANNYLVALNYFNDAVKLAYISDISKVYLFDMEYPGTGMFVVAKYDADFH